jgi:hypothetical protein
MKATLVLISLMLGQNALAQGNWMFSEENAAKPAATVIVPIPRPAILRAPAAAKKTPAQPSSTVADGCSNNFAKASAYFKAVHGNDVDIQRIGEFQGSFKDFTATNTLKNSGGSLILNLNIGGMINTDVPVTICKRGKRLTAALLTSKARESGSSQPHQMISQMVARGEAPRSITLSITRSRNTLYFSGRSGSTRVTAAASIR